MEESEETTIIELRKDDCFSCEGYDYIVIERFKNGCLIAVDKYASEYKFRDSNLIVYKY